MTEIKLIPSAQPDCAVLIKEFDVRMDNKANLMYTYIQKLNGLGVEKPGFRFSFIGLKQNPDPKKKVRKADAIEELKVILEHCDTQGISTLLITDATYFQHCTNRKKLEDSIDDVYDCAIEGYEHIKVLPSIHYNTVQISPNKSGLLEKSLKVLAAHLLGTHEAPGSDVLKDYRALTEPAKIREALKELLKYPELACDIETVSLRSSDSPYVYTIAFATDKHSAVAFPVNEYYVSKEDSKLIKQYLKGFLKEYKGKLWFHNALFDATFIVRDLFMDSLDDYAGVHEGVAALDNIQDTMILAYLATNSTLRTSLSLKELSKEFTGEYAIDATDITQFTLEEVLEYNAKDVCGTFYLKDTYYPFLATDDQTRVYNEIMQPSIGVLTKMQLNGLPMNPDRVKEVRSILEDQQDKANKVLKASHYVKRTVSVMQYNASVKYNATHKVKQKAPDEIEVEFNPNSSTQLRILLFDILGFEPIDVSTKTKEGKTDRASIKAFKAQAENDGEKDVAETLQALVDISETSIILNTFLTAFETYAVPHKDGRSWLNGSYRLGGTISGRLSASSPNLMNLPSGSKQGKLIKSIFQAPEGFLFCGSDYDQLEDRCMAQVAKCEAKTKIFRDGFDAHCLNALAYYKDQMPGIDPNDKDAVNSIADTHGDLRQRSKASTFALNYGGTYMTLNKRNGIPLSEAKGIEAGHKELYKAVHKLAETNQIQGMTKGYVTGAFGLRLRTPRLVKAKGSQKLTSEQVAEGRSASNMTVQSYGMLTNLAAIKFDRELTKSKYRLDVKIMAHIHDALYCCCKDDPEVIKWVNDTLIKCMRYSEAPLNDPDVPISSGFDIGKAWDFQLTLPNDATMGEVMEIRKKLDEASS